MYYQSAGLRQKKKRKQKKKEKGKDEHIEYKSN